MNSNETKGSNLYYSVFQKMVQEIEIEKKQKLIKSIQTSQMSIKNFQSSLVDKGSNNKTERLLRKLEDYTTKFNELENSVKNIDESFMLFVIGTGKYGKSSLINSLIGEEVAEIGILPKTWKIDIFKKKVPHAGAMIKYRNGQEKRVTKEDAREIILLEENKRSESDKIIKKKLREYKANSNEEFKEYKIQLEREELYHSNIVEVQHSSILESCYVVDTPGLNQNIMGEIRNNVQDYYHKADGIIWMLDATAIAANNAKKLLEELQESLKDVGNNQQNNMIGVLNRIDLVHNNQGVDGVNSVLADARKIYEGYFKKILPFSAKQAFESITNSDEELKVKSGLKELQKEIESSLDKTMRFEILSKKKASNYQYNKVAREKIEEYVNSLEQDFKKYNILYQEFNRKLEKKVEYFMSKIKIEKYKEQVLARYELYRDNFMNDYYSEYNFLQNKILVLDDFNRELSIIGYEICEEFNKLAQNYIEVFQFSEYPIITKLDEVTFQMKFHFETEFDVEEIEIGIKNFVSRIGIGESINAFMGYGAVGTFIDNWNEKKAKKNFESIMNNYLVRHLNRMSTELQIEFTTKINNIVEEIRYQIESHIRNSFLEVYSFDNIIKLDNNKNNILEVIDSGRQTLHSLTNIDKYMQPSMREIVLKR